MNLLCGCAHKEQKTETIAKLFCKLNWLIETNKEEDEWLNNFFFKCQQMLGGG